MMSDKNTLKMRYDEIRSRMQTELRRGKFRNSMAKQFTIQVLQCQMRFPERYYSIDVVNILRLNTRENHGPGAESLIKCIGILEAYGKNLLKPEKPLQWRLIRKSNPKFKSEVAPVKESRKILNMLGYTVDVDDGLAYPEHSMGPDVPVVASVTTDLILFRQELILVMKDQHPQDMRPWIPSYEINDLRRVNQEFENNSQPRKAPPEYSPTDTNPLSEFTSMPTPYMSQNMLSSQSRFNQSSEMQSMPYFSETNSRTYTTPTQAGIDVPENSWSTQSSSQTSVPIKRPQITNLQANSARRGTATAMPAHVSLSSVVEEPKDCLMCCEIRAVYECKDCNESIKYLCKDCFDMYHKNPRRKAHNKVLLKYETPRAVRPSSSATHTSTMTAAAGEPWNVPSTSKQNSFVASSISNPQTTSEFSTGSMPVSVGSQGRNSLTASDWDQKVAELIDVTDPQRRKERTETLFVEIKQKINNYNRIMEEIKSKNPTATSLFGHIDEKINELQTIKNVVETLSSEIDESVQPIEPENFEGDITMEENGNEHYLLMPGSSQSFISQAHPSLNDHNQEGSETQPSSILGKRRKMEMEEKLSLTSQPTSQPTSEIDTQATTTGKSFIPSDKDEDITVTKRLNDQQNNLMDVSPLHGQVLEDHEFASVPSGNFHSSIPGFQTASLLPDPGDNIFQLMDVDPLFIQDMIKKEKTKLETSKMVDYLRSLRTQGKGRFKPKHLSVAMNKVNVGMGGDPILWLQQHWSGLVDEVKHRTIFPHVTNSYIDQKLVEFDADVQQAVSALDDSARRCARKLSEFPENEVISAMQESTDGSKTQALAILQRKEVQIMMQDVEKTKRTPLSDVYVQLIYTHSPQAKHMLIRYLSKSFTNEYYVELMKEFWINNVENLNETITDNDIITALKNTDNLDDALHQLDKECQICTEHMPFTKIMNLPTCGDNPCAYCHDCLFEHLKICIRDKNIRDTTCPVCGQPDIDDDDETATNHFNAIDQVLKANKDLHELFQSKLRDFTLRKMPNFRWCSHCTAGFQFEPENAENLKMLCPYCKKGTCYKCKKPWEAQHEGISCENFKKWKEQNDPEFQAQGLAAHLKENGIDCPDCKFRYALAKGGCMHFKCTQCSHEFCCGCNSAFRKGKACNVSASCGRKGLHAHHPRDCLFHLRDCSTKDLQNLLRMNSVQFNTVGSNFDKCQVMEQKELPGGLTDAECGRNISADHGGLCDLHYKEYLVNLVNTNRLDPAEILDIDRLKACLFREEANLPKRNNMSNNQYKQVLLQEVKKLKLCHQR